MGVDSGAEAGLGTLGWVSSGGEVVMISEVRRLVS